MVAFTLCELALYTLESWVRVTGMASCSPGSSDVSTVGLRVHVASLSISLFVGKAHGLLTWKPCSLCIPHFDTDEFGQIKDFLLCCLRLQKSISQRNGSVQVLVSAAPEPIAHA